MKYDCKVPPLCFSPLHSRIVSLGLVLRENGVGWTHLFAEGVPRARPSQFLSCPPTVSTLSHKWNALNTSPDLSWGPLAPTKQSLPYNFLKLPALSKQLCYVKLCGKNVLKIFYKLTPLWHTHSGFGPPWWSGLSACWTDSFFRFWSYSE